MALELEEIKEHLKDQSKKSEISKAIKHENRLRFHTESYLSPSDLQQPVTDFLNWVKSLLPKDKYQVFLSLFSLPTPTVQLTGSIFTELERVFDGRNASVTYQFTDSELNDDWEEYRKDDLNYPEVWRKKGWDSVKTSINSVLIVDLPAESLNATPEPYFYFLDISKVLDYSTTGEDMDWIIFSQGDKKIAVFDDASFRVFELDKNGQIIDTPVVDSPHDLGYCPAKFFWSTELNQKQPDLKKSPLTPQLGNLDWLLFFSISKRHLDLYAPYPIYSTYEADCDFANGETGSYCDGGFLRNEDEKYIVLGAENVLMKCPVCSDKRLAGVGTYIEVPVPESKDDPDLRDPVTITSIDRESLDYNVEEVKRLADEVFKHVVGSGGEVQQKKALNEIQVQANFESKTSILNSLKPNLEKARKFVDKTICKLRYGTRFIGASISMGTEFYIASTSELYEQYKTAKTNGASDAELDAINSKIIETEHRTNPVAMQRMSILKQLEPYRHFTFTDLMNLESRNLLSEDLLQVKLNFNIFVERFERENTNIIEFGSDIEFHTKIELINKQLLSYGTESTGKLKKPEPEPKTGI
jgi:hypothetical protein